MKEAVLTLSRLWRELWGRSGRKITILCSRGRVYSVSPDLYKSFLSNTETSSLSFLRLLCPAISTGRLFLSEWWLVRLHQLFWRKLRNINLNLGRKLCLLLRKFSLSRGFVRSLCFLKTHRLVYRFWWNCAKTRSWNIWTDLCLDISWLFFISAWLNNL